MNKILYILSLLLTLVLASCSSDPVVNTDDTQQAISFGNEMSNENDVTRSSGLEESRTTFYVYGYKTLTSGTQEVISGYRVNWVENTAGSTESNTDGWEYVGQGTNGAVQTVKYWDFSATDYRFFGISTADGSAINPTVDGINRSFSFTADATSDDGIANVPYISDLWQTGDPVTSAKSPVTLVFRKPFCKVRIKLIDVDGNQYVNTKILKKESLSFAPTTSSDGSLITKGTITITYPTSGSTVYSFSTSTNSTNITIDKIDEPYEPGATLYFATTKEKWYTLLPPTQSTQGTFSLKATIASKDKEAVVPAEFMNWKPGYAYTYIFKIVDGGIYFVNVDVVAIEDWEGGQTEDHTVYNW